MATNTIAGNVHLHPSAAEIPHTHDPDCVVVVPNGPNRWNRKEPYPIGSIVALPGGEPIGPCPRSCIHVTVENGDFYIRNGLIAIEAAAPLLVCMTPFPELARLLQKKPEGLTELIEVRTSEKPWTGVKNFHQGDSDFVLKEGFIGPCEGFNALVGWNGFQRNNSNWHDRVDHAFGPQKFATNLESNKRRLRGIYAALGLKPGTWTDLKVQEMELFTCIEVALRVAQEPNAI